MIIFNRLRSVCFGNLSRFKYTIDYTRVPQLVKTELEEQFVRGGGPGGQATNKTANCVVLKHIPTGLVVKCHQSRSLDENRRTARSLLVRKLDNYFNKDDSVEEQKKREELRKSREYERRRLKLQKMKNSWKERENLK